VTARDDWGYKPRHLLKQGACEDMATVNRYYYGHTDDDEADINALHGDREN
jgi:hypothetical protein